MCDDVLSRFPSCCMTFSLHMERSLLRQGSANYSGLLYENINLNLQPSIIFDTYCISEYGVRSVHETVVYTAIQKAKRPN